MKSFLFTSGVLPVDIVILRNTIKELKTTCLAVKKEKMNKVFYLKNYTPLNPLSLRGEIKIKTGYRICKTGQEITEEEYLCSLIFFKSTNQCASSQLSASPISTFSGTASSKAFSISSFSFDGISSCSASGTSKISSSCTCNSILVSSSCSSRYS